MILGIDYDDTYTRDPVLWNHFVDSALERGHTVWCVSARSEVFMEEPRATLGRLIGSDKCVGTGGAPKRDFMFRSMGVYVDVWIDDSPEAVVQDADSDWVRKNRMKKQWVLETTWNEDCPKEVRETVAHLWRDYLEYGNDHCYWSTSIEQLKKLEEDYPMVQSIIDYVLPFCFYDQKEKILIHYWW